MKKRLKKMHLYRKIAFIATSSQRKFLFHFFVFAFMFVLTLKSYQNCSDVNLAITDISSSISHGDGHTILTPNQPKAERKNLRVVGFADMNKVFQNGEPSVPDIIWRDITTGEIYITFNKGMGLYVAYDYTEWVKPIVDSKKMEWNLVSVDQFDLEHLYSSDFFWYNTRTGETYIWIMDGSEVISQGSLLQIQDLNWKPQGVGDLNGDSVKDILWVHSTTGQVNVWLMNGTRNPLVVQLPSLPQNQIHQWKSMGVGNFTGKINAGSDVLWYNEVSGESMLYHIESISPQGVAQMKPEQGKKFFNAIEPKYLPINRMMFDTEYINQNNFSTDIAPIFNSSLGSTGFENSIGSQNLDLTGTIYWVDKNSPHSLWAWKLNPISSQGSDLSIPAPDIMKIVNNQSGSSKPREVDSEWTVVGIKQNLKKKVVDILWQNINNYRVYLYRMAGEKIVFEDYIWIPDDPHFGENLYFSKEVHTDSSGIIAPWYMGLNGQIDQRIRVSADTIKRYPWVLKDETRSFIDKDEGGSPLTKSVKAAMTMNEIGANSNWRINEATGEIQIPLTKRWWNGDLGQRTNYLVTSLSDYYKYSGDPFTIGLVKLQVDYILDHWLTPPSDSQWPLFPISVPTVGNPYEGLDLNSNTTFYDGCIGRPNYDRMKGAGACIQLDMAANIGVAVLRAYKLTGENRYLEMAHRWGLSFARNQNPQGSSYPWTRYAKINPDPNYYTWDALKLTGGVSIIAHFLDQLIETNRITQTNTADLDALIEAKNRADDYLKYLLSKWKDTDTWGRYYWDWEEGSMGLHFIWATQYMMAHPSIFANWKNDVRNLSNLFLNRSSVDPLFGSGVYSGSWAVPEGSSCCSFSFSYGTQMMANGLAQYSRLLPKESSDKYRSLEMARRMSILSSYDFSNNGTIHDAIKGADVVGFEWVSIIHPMALREYLGIISWMPEYFAPLRENHLIRSRSEVVDIKYSVGKIEYATFGTIENNLDVLRVSSIPSSVRARLQGSATNQPGNWIDLSKVEFQQSYLYSDPPIQNQTFAFESLGNGDYIIWLRHDSFNEISIQFPNDPQTKIASQSLISDPSNQKHWVLETDGSVSTYTEGGTLNVPFRGNQIRMIGAASPEGGRAEVYLDGQKLLSQIDSWSPVAKTNQVLFSTSGLLNGNHTLTISAVGQNSPGAKRLGNGKVNVLEFQSTESNDPSYLSSGIEFNEDQRMIFGYEGREDIRWGGGLWRPGLEWLISLFSGAHSSIAEWTTPLAGVDSIYAYGIHAHEFKIYLTVSPGSYVLRLYFTAREGFNNKQFVVINQDSLNTKIIPPIPDSQKTQAIAWEGVTSKNGMIELRFNGDYDYKNNVPLDAFIQALELKRE